VPACLPACPANGGTLPVPTDLSRYREVQRYRGTEVQRYRGTQVVDRQGRHTSLMDQPLDTKQEANA
jgi:hypothetical protein